MAPPAGVNGVLPAAILQKNAPNSTPRGPKPPSPRMKLICRRLPPGLTQAEFEAVIGDDWKMGAGRVDWFMYKRGKISKDAAKPSKPSKAYFHVTQQQYITALGNVVRQSSFLDATKSFQDPALVGPPVVEFAPYHRVFTGKKRTDNRQGTIDQDPEFKAFLESLTNPITKPTGIDAQTEKPGKVTTTPLIEALREKKANKDKAKAAAKHGRGESKDDAGGEKKMLNKSGKDVATTGADKGRKLSKNDKATKEAVKVLNKMASASKDASASTSSEKAASSASSPAPERKRGNALNAKAMLQRDLGIGPAANRRRGAKKDAGSAAQDAAQTTEDTKQKAKDPAPPVVAAAASAEKSVPPKKEPGSKPSRAERRAYKASLTDRTNTKNMGEDVKSPTKAAAAPAPTILKKPQNAPNPTPKGPIASREPPTEPAAARSQTGAAPVAPSTKAGASLGESAGRASKAAQPAATNPTPGATSRQAFLKHANPSQGITEPLIEEALKPFGTVEKVEIDKRKGFAYVDFAEPEGLQKAMAASPIKVAQGAVQVLERKEKVVRNRAPHPGPPTGPHIGTHGPPTGPSRGRGGFAGRGRGRGGARGGAHVPAGAGAADTPPAASAPGPVSPTGAAT
ncbi:hypothetical protein P154DRAFT_40238 [Amniculicola lignicola CBS 123094]|uniref:RRM domain-containing protein n=1 Tax=Amniculicola lignicola CBS 123094 TaxID=1392246 RepID=A0A6A5W1N4_9PLEO|nr:hypothetical protein P154DRAFT_40238 [Amniculicola lignicola CBS 123094]